MTTQSIAEALRSSSSRTGSGFALPIQVRRPPVDRFEKPSAIGGRVVGNRVRPSRANERQCRPRSGVRRIRRYATLSTGSTSPLGFRQASGLWQDRHTALGSVWAAPARRRTRIVLVVPRPPAPEGQCCTGPIRSPIVCPGKLPRHSGRCEPSCAHHAATNLGSEKKWRAREDSNL